MLKWERDLRAGGQDKAIQRMNVQRGRHEAIINDQRRSGQSKRQSKDDQRDAIEEQEADIDPARNPHLSLNVASPGVVWWSFGGQVDWATLGGRLLIRLIQLHSYWVCRRHRKTRGRRHGSWGEGSLGRAIHVPMTKSISAQQTIHMLRDNLIES
ncbi:hypothetical protein BU24DRAFT_413187 [Aaosphaeria arxii CBS 175.79]|uniref:Uncharacterized protein n=1 Tax=Aaosphaeria arxii CBS 175.79 TaxID=1450172 RepID=A0A6A5XEP3_9PLEO|nr:uncharacterized protein BU24DRAFT_413187 [Aaosphaeria arxii CBS 175.79]KAF2011552.1 hypothetical protein BU24DRAFT_413187 [Aaosphaeria arxii CBS 175.79]